MKIGGWAPHELHEHEAEEVARDEAEGVRLAYVAATRARDLLVVPALGDEPWEGGWFGPLNRALYPPVGVAPDGGARAEVSGVQVEGHGAASGPNDEPAGPVDRLSRPARVCRGRLLGRLVGSRRGGARARPEAAVRRPARGADRQGRAEATSSPTAERATTAGGWRGPTRARLAPCRRSVADDGPRVDGRSRRIRCRPAARRCRGRDRHRSREPAAAIAPGGAAFGVLVHAVLAQAPFDATRERCSNASRDVEARVLGLARTMPRRPRQAVERVLRARAARTRARRGRPAARCRRETPVTLHARRRHARRGRRRSGVRGAGALDRRGLQDRSRARRPPARSAIAGRSRSTPRRSRRRRARPPRVCSDPTADDVSGTSVTTV